MLGNFFANYQAYNLDSWVVLLIILTTLSIAYSSKRIGRINKKSGYNRFAIAFIFISISYVFQMLARAVVYSTINPSVSGFFASLSEIFPPQVFNVLFHSLYEFFNLLGFFLILSVLFSIKNRKIILGVLLCLGIAMLGVGFQSVFHITSAVFLIFLTARLYENYTKHQGAHSFLVLAGFALLLIGSLLLIFSVMNGAFYFLGGLITLIAYFILLINQVHIFTSNGTKEN